MNHLNISIENGDIWDGISSMRYKFDKNNRIYPFRRLFSQCRNNSFKNSNDYSRKNRREQALLARILIANHASHFHYIPSNDIYIWMEKFGARNRWNSETLLKGHAIHPQLRKKKKSWKNGNVRKKVRRIPWETIDIVPFFFLPHSGYYSR